jgi:hypothetical protein
VVATALEAAVTASSRRRAIIGREEAQVAMHNLHRKVRASVHAREETP